MIEVFGIRLDRSMDSSQFDRIIRILPCDQQERIRSRRGEDAQRSLLGQILIRYMIRIRINTSFTKIVLQYNEYGKPILVGDTSVQFNISHSGEWVVGALSNYPVGIDVEKLDPIDLGIARRFLVKSEFDELCSIAGPEVLYSFYDLWTVKESYIKAIGMGLSMPLDSFLVLRENHKIMIRTDGLMENCYFKQYDLDHQHIMSVCSMLDNEFADKVVIGRVHDFL